MMTVRRALENRFVRFLLVGGINTLFGYGVFALCIFIGIHYAAAALIATVCGVLFNFKTTGTIVFKNGDNALIFRFLGVYAALYTVNTGFLKIFKHFDVDMYLAGAVMLLPMAILAFLLNRKFVFVTQAR